MMCAAPIRVLHLIASNFVGGPEKQILHHAVDARELAIEVTVGSFRDQAARADILEQAEQRGLTTFEILATGRFDLGAIGQLASFLKRERIDLLCTHGYKANVVGTLAKKIAGVPQIAFCRGWTAETAAIRVYEFLDRRALFFADRIVSVSEAQGKVLARNPFLRRKVSVVQNAVLDPIEAVSREERAARKRELGFAPDTRLIGAVGRLSTEKGQRFLVEAAAELHREFRDLKIVLVGEGRDREGLEARIAELGLKDVLLLPGFQKNVATWMRAFDALVNCSLTEGLPNVVLEAMAAGTPVVATEVGGVPELIANGKTGVLVPAGDVAALATGVASVLRDREYGLSLGEAGRKWVAERFSPERQRERLLEIYSHCVGHSVVPTAKNSEGTPSGSIAPFISVVIPVRNEEKHLGAVISGLLQQEYPKDQFEIVVADGNSTDGTVRLVEQISATSASRIRVLPNAKQLSSAGRNVGVRASTGEIVVFIDGHCHIQSGKLLADTARLFAETGADCLCRPQPLTAPGGTLMQKIVADVRASRIGHGLDSTIYAEGQEGFIDPTSSGASYRRTVFAKIGEYDERLDACEDVEFNYRVHRAGLRAFTSPCLTVQYQARGTLRGLWKQMVRYGRGRFRFVRLHPEAFSLGQAIPPVFVLWMLLGAIVAAFSRDFAIPFLATAAVYVGAVMASSLALGMKHGWKHLAVAPAVYGIIHVGLGWGFLRELLGGNSLAAPEGAGVHLTVKLEERPAEKIVSRQSNNGREIVNAFSIDVEDYFHTEAMSEIIPTSQWGTMPTRVEANTRRIFEMLAKHNVRGTFFFLGWVAEQFPELVREALGRGHEIGCHSFWHRRVYTLGAKEFRADTLRAKQAIEDAGGVAVRGYRAPSFSIVQGTEWALDILMELGFDYDSSSNPVRHDLYNNAGAPRVPHRPGGRGILELPVTTTKFAGNVFPIAGGGYTRILPYAYTHWGLSRFLRQEARPAIMYFHPWEIDPQQPRLPAKPRTRFRQYTGLNTTEWKLEKLLTQFEFAPIAKVFEKELQETAAVRQSGAEKKPADRLASGDSEEPCLNAATPSGGEKWSS